MSERGVTGGAAPTWLQGKARQVSLQGLVDVEAPLLVQLHGEGCREQFRDRADPIKRVRSGRALRRHIRIAETTCPHGGLVIDQRDAEPGDAMPAHAQFDQLGQIALRRRIVATHDRGWPLRRAGTAQQARQQQGDQA